ncbi:hypothetical protein FPV67DRAFT_629045 [Lyophyllum atratum]|nr:hypothetical protein FPV67DRAFT_629045 [Lyophyllum atratum]
MSTTFSIVEARITSFFVENVVFGLYLVTFAYTVIALFSTESGWRKTRELNYRMVAVVMLMFFNMTMTSAMSFMVIWRGFVVAPPGTAAEIFRELTYWPVVVKSGCLLFQTIIGDAMLIYRCWVVYARSWKVIAFSALLWIAGTVCAIFILYQEATFKVHGLVSSSKIRPYGVAFWASSLTLNIITTTLLVWPIWKAARWHQDGFGCHDSLNVHSSNNTMKHVTQVIIESGSLYTMVAFVTFVTYAVGHNALYVASSAELGTCGIAFNLIIIRIANKSHVDYVPSGQVGSGLPLHIRTLRETVDDKGHVRFVISHDTDHAEQGVSRQIEESKTRVEQEL